MVQVIKMFFIIVALSAQIYLQISDYRRLILLPVACLCSLVLSAQVEINVTDADGFALNIDSALAFNSFGVLVKTKKSMGRLTCAGPVRRITVGSHGYQTLDTFYPAEITGTTTLVLRNKVGLLEEVVVSTGKMPSRLSRSNVSISVLKPYLIENKATADISTILEQVPGVNVTDGQVNIRSGSGWSYGAGSRVMVTLDELPMLSPDANAVQFSFLPVENLASVEVIKSAGSVLYGSSALNGVVNLRSAEPDEQPNARVSAFAGMYDLPRRDSLNWNGSRRGVHGINGFWSQKLGKTSLTIQWNGLYDQGYRMNEMNHRARAALRLKQQSKVKGLSYGLNTGFQQGKSGSFLLWENYQYGYNSLDSSYTFNRSTRFNADPFAEWQRPKGNHKLMGRFLLIDNNITSDNAGSDQSNSSGMLYGEYRYNRKLGRLNLTGGAAGMAAETRSPLFGGNQRASNAAAFAQAEYTRPRWNATAGARYEYFAVNDYRQRKPVFRAGFNFRPARATFLRVSAGQGFRFPSMAEMFISTSSGAVTVFANPNLRPETGWNAEAGVKQGFQLFGFKGYADFSVFETVLENMMEFTFGQWSLSPLAPNLGLGFKSINTGKGRIRGLELEAAGDGQIGKTRWQLLGGYTFTDARSLTPDLTYATDSAGSALSFNSTRSDSVNFLKYRFRHLFRIDVQCTWKRLEAGVSLRYNSPMPNIDRAFVDGVLPYFIPGIAESRIRIPDATVLDLRLAYNVNNHWRVNLLVSNVFNREYMYRPADIRPPRSFQLQAVWKLR